MSGIMNNYFYGKAGQADYTVEQMPTNRKQLFFTTLKVRFSSMVGINLMHFVWMLPLLIWLFLGYQTLGLYMGLDATSDEQREQLRSVAPEIVTEYEAFEKLDNEYQRLVSEYGSREMVEDKLKADQVVTLYKTDEEGNKVEEKQIDEAYWNDTILTERADHFKTYSTHLIQQRNGNIITTLLIAIPLFAIASIGRPGMMYVLRNWARDEHSFMWQDYKAAIKGNWKQALPLGIFNGLSFLLFFVAWTFYGEQANSSWFFAIPQGLMLVRLIIWWMMNEVIYTMMVTYDMKLFTLIRNSVLMVIARLPIAFLILLGTVAVPFILLLIPMPFSFLALLIVYVLIGFALVGFVQASFSNACFDRYLNPRIEGAEVNKGLYQPDPEEEAAAKQDMPEVEVKEDRYWEHKTHK